MASYSRESNTDSIADFYSLLGSRREVLSQPLQQDVLSKLNQRVEKHPQTPLVTMQENIHAIAHWPFAKASTIKYFLMSDVSHWATSALPRAPVDRLRLSIRLTILVTQTDDIMENNNFEENSQMMLNVGNLATNAIKLTPEMGPVERYTASLFGDVRAMDSNLVVELGELTRRWAHCLVDISARDKASRELPWDSEEFLDYRFEDSGQPFLFALIRFAYNLPLTPEELDRVAELEKNAGRYVQIINDLMSTKKEVHVSEQEHTGEAGKMNISTIFSLKRDHPEMSWEEAEERIWKYFRELEANYATLVCTIKAQGPMSKNLEAYVGETMELYMAGNAYWYLTSRRYHVHELPDKY